MSIEASVFDAGAGRSNSPRRYDVLFGRVIQEKRYSESRRPGVLFFDMYNASSVGRLRRNLFVLRRSCQGCNRASL